MKPLVLTSGNRVLTGWVNDSARRSCQVSRTSVYFLRLILVCQLRQPSRGSCRRQAEIFRYKAIKSVGRVLVFGKSDQEAHSLPIAEAEAETRVPRIIEISFMKISAPFAENTRSVIVGPLSSSVM